MSCGVRRIDTAIDKMEECRVAQIARGFNVKPPIGVRRIGGYLYGVFCCEKHAEEFMCDALEFYEAEISVYQDGTIEVSLSWEN